MAFFSPKLFKAASGAEVMPVSEKRSNEPFESPVFETYLANNDIAGYMTALWKGVAARDVESMRVLFYLSIRCEEPDNALTLMDMLTSDTDDEYTLAFWTFFEPMYKKLNEENDDDLDRLQQTFEIALQQGDEAYRRLYPDFPSLFTRFGDSETTLLRAYITNVGREIEDEAEEEIEIHDCAPQDLKDEWRSLYHRDDCSSSQMAIFHQALPYAQQGDPYAMFIVGYLYNNGIRTKYDHPNVDLLDVDHEKARYWLRPAAEAGVVKACWQMACALCDARFLIESDADKPEVIKYVDMGAKQNDPDCLEWLFNNAKEAHQRFEYLERLAEAYRTYQYEIELSEWLAEGKGCEKDEKRAYELADHVYRHTEVSPYDDSHEKAAKLLARYLENGIGCEPDPDRARDIRRGLSSDWSEMMELLSR